MARFYAELLPRSALCFDVGANVGERTATFLSLGAKVVAVEPQPDLAAGLRVRFASGVEVVEAALGSEEGEAELMLADYHTLATLSPAWVDAVRKSGRFDEFNWDGRIVVALTTLDRLIERHGLPDFVKVDVEGYESEVIRGLSQPLRCLAFEFDVEQRAPRLDAVERLAQLGFSGFNFSFGESFEFAFPESIVAGAMIDFLSSSRHTPETFGDVYAFAGS